MIPGIIAAGISKGVVAPTVLWTPSEISTALWLDAEDAATITEVSSAVSQWNDKSGNARHVAQATSDARPTWPAAQLNGLPVVRFDGSDDRLVSSDVSLHSGQWSVFAVVKSSSAAATSEAVLAQDQSLSSIKRIAQYLNCNAGLENVNSIGFNDAGSAFAATKAQNVSDFTLCHAARSSDAIAVSSNGVFGSSTATTGTPETGSIPIALGARKSGTTTFTQFFLGDIAEIVFIASAVDTAIRQKTEGYLAHKWGLTASLAGDHPYKTDPPYVAYRITENDFVRITEAGDSRIME